MPQPELSELLTFVSKKWMLELISFLRSGSMRFSEILETIDGISNKVLSDRLKELQDLDLIIKSVYSLIPLNIKYKLSDKGLELASLYDTIKQYTYLMQ